MFAVPCVSSKSVALITFGPFLSKPPSVSPLHNIFSATEVAFGLSPPVAENHFSTGYNCLHGAARIARATYALTCSKNSSHDSMKDDEYR